MMSEGSPSKARAGVKPMSLNALNGDEGGSSNNTSSSNLHLQMMVTPPPEPVGDYDGNSNNSAAAIAPPAATTITTPTGRTVVGGRPQSPPLANYGHCAVPGGGSHNGGGGLPHPPGITPPMPAGGGGGTPTHGMANYGGSAGMNLPSPSGLTETEYLHTRNLVPHVQQRALVAVMQSLIDDFPSLTPVIRIRCEKAMAFVMAQQQREASSQQSQPHTPQMMAANHNPSSGGGGGHGSSSYGRIAGTPPADCQLPGITPPGSCTKSSSGKRQGSNAPLNGGNSANRREQEEQEQCGVHGNLRAAKHLNYNLGSQRWECIPGFHCLVDNTASVSSLGGSMRVSSPPPAPIFPGGGSSFGGGAGSRPLSVSNTPNGGNTPMPVPSPVKAGSLLVSRRGSQPMLGGGGVGAGPIGDHMQHSSYSNPHSQHVSGSATPRLGLGLGSNSSHGMSAETVFSNGGGGGGGGNDVGGSEGSPTAVDVDRLTSLLDALKE